MSTRNRILIAIGLFLLPILVRSLYFYQGFYSNSKIQQPDYAQYTVPVPPTPSHSQKAAAAAPSGKVVVIDNIHANQFEPSEIEPLVTALSSLGATVEFDDGAKKLEMELKYASSYLVFAPSTAFSGDELRTIQQFVSSGGRLLVFSDPTRVLSSYDFYGNQTIIPDVNFVNPLIAPYGLTVVNDYLYNLDTKSNEGNFRNVKFVDFATSPITTDLNMVVLYGAHSIHAENGTSLVSGNETTFSSLTDKGSKLVPLALSSDGLVLAAGDFSFITNPFNQVADNALLMSHVAEFATSGERSPLLANFPYVFQRPVSLVATGDIELSASLLEPIAGLQKTLKATNIPVNVRSRTAIGGDAIILGSFTPSDDLAPFLKPFKIELEDGQDQITIPGFGKVGSTGSGILLFTHGAKSNTLVLLAATTKDMSRLINLVASGDLSVCVLEENIAVCNLVLPDDSSGGFDYFPFPTTESPIGDLPTPEGLPTPTLVPTPSG